MTRQAMKPACCIKATESHTESRCSSSTEYKADYISRFRSAGPQRSLASPGGGVELCNLKLNPLDFICLFFRIPKFDPLHIEVTYFIALHVTKHSITSYISSL